MRPPRTLLGLVLAAVMLAGCANLAAIREFAATSTEAAQYRTIVADYIDAPVRIKTRYAPADQAGRWDDIARARKAEEARLLALQQVVAQYMDSLGQLAADDLVVYDKELDGLNKSLVRAGALKSGESDAVAAITKLVLKAGAEAWRRRQLRELIESANAPFQVVVGALHTTVTQGFMGELENERAALRNHYETLVRSSNDPAGIAALREWQTLRRADVDERENVAHVYAGLLQKIAAGHEALYEHRGDLSSRQLLADMHKYSKDIKAAFNAVHASKRGEP